MVGFLESIGKRCENANVLFVVCVEDGNGWPDGTADGCNVNGSTWGHGGKRLQRREHDQEYLQVKEMGFASARFVLTVHTTGARDVCERQTTFYIY